MQRLFSVSSPTTGNGKTSAIQNVIIISGNATTNQNQKNSKWDLPNLEELDPEMLKPVDDSNGEIATLILNSVARYNIELYLYM